MGLDINTKKLKKNAFRVSKERGIGASRIRVPGGYLNAEVLGTIQEIAQTYGNGFVHLTTRQGVEIEGIFSHLALTGDEENKEQFDLMCEFIEEIESKGHTFKFKHIADSIATVDYPEYRMNMVRAGALIYGMRGFHKGFLPVEQAMTFRTAISQIHEIKAGEA